MNPGITRRPPRSVSWTPSPRSSFGTSVPTQTIRSPATRRCRRPRGPGSYNSALRINSIIGEKSITSVEAEAAYRGGETVGCLGEMSGRRREFLGGRGELFGGGGDLLGGGGVVLRPRRHFPHPAGDALDQAAHLACRRGDPASPRVVCLGVRCHVDQSLDRGVCRV